MAVACSPDAAHPTSAEAAEAVAGSGRPNRRRPNNRAAGVAEANNDALTFHYSLPRSVVSLQHLPLALRSSAQNLAHSRLSKRLSPSLAFSRQSLPLHEDFKSIPVSRKLPTSRRLFSWERQESFRLEPISAACAIPPLTRRLRLVRAILQIFVAFVIREPLKLLKNNHDVDALYSNAVPVD